MTLRSIRAGALIVLAALPVVALPMGPASAQLLDSPAEPRLDLEITPMNFDLWCQETMRYPAERCEQRLAADMREFESFRAVIERQETLYLMEQRRDAEAFDQADRDYGSPWTDYNDPLGR